MPSGGNGADFTEGSDRPAAAAGPGSRYLKMEGIGHFPMVEHPRLFLDKHLLRVLDELACRLPRALPVTVPLAG